MIADLKLKYQSLITILKSYESAAVAFSGGVDSTFLAKAAFDALGNKSLVITIDSEAYSPADIMRARELARYIGIKLIEISLKITDIPEFCANTPERCYFCKKELFTIMLNKAKEEGIHVLMDGSHKDDDNDYRPGLKALDELHIKSPLKEHDFTKNEIRLMSKELGLPTWNMQSSTCLASRFPYGHEITPECLEKAWKAETILREIGITQYRIRDYGQIARIEVDREDFTLLLDKIVRDKIVKHLKMLGYTYVTLDLEGYRTGSMNEVLKEMK